MWELGHLGIGSKLASPFSRRLPYGWLLFGTVLPDLIDKPLYYGLSFFTGERGSDLGLISCTRTIAHTGIFLVLIAGVAFVKKSRPLTAIALGVLTHFLLDGLQDYWIHMVQGIPGESSMALAAFFPLLHGVYNPRFGIMPFSSLGEHLRSGTKPFLLITEGVGALFLAADYFRRRNARRRAPHANE